VPTATLLWHKGGTSNKASSVSFTATSAVPAPGYICVAIAAQNAVGISSVSPSANSTYQVNGQFYLVIWKAVSGSLSGTFTVNFSASAGNVAYSAWAIGNASWVFYGEYLPKRCTLSGKNYYARWIGYLGSAGALGAPDFTLVRSDNTSSTGPKSSLYALASDKYSSFTTSDWVDDAATYPISGSASAYDVRDFWFIPSDAYATDPVMPCNAAFLVADAGSKLPLADSAFVDVINVSFPPARSVRLFSTANPSFDVEHSIYSRGVFLRPTTGVAKRNVSPFYISDTWPSATLSPGIGEVRLATEPTVFLSASLPSLAQPSILTLEPGTASAGQSAGSDTYQGEAAPIGIGGTFGYPVPSLSAGTSDALNLHSAPVAVECGTYVGLVPSQVPEMAYGIGIWSIVPSARLTREPAAAIAPAESGVAHLVLPTTSCAVSPSVTAVSLLPSRARIFVAPTDSLATAPGPVAPCLIRLTWGAHDLCLKDYKAFEVDSTEGTLTVRLGVELAYGKETSLHRLLSLLKPGQIVVLDTILAGGFKGSYLVRDISSVTLAKRTTFDILLEEADDD